MSDLELDAVSTIFRLSYNNRVYGAILKRETWPFHNLELVVNKKICKKIEDSVPEEHKVWLSDEEVVFAGSFVLHAFLKSPTWEPNDIDIFYSFYSREKVNEFCASLGIVQKDEENKEEGYFLAITIPGDKNVQYIRNSRKSYTKDIVKGVLKNFDSSQVQCAYSNGRLFVTPAFKYSLQFKFAFFSKCSGSSYGVRSKKYESRGFKIVNLRPIFKELTLEDLQ